MSHLQNQTFAVYLAANSQTSQALDALLQAYTDIHEYIYALYIYNVSIKVGLTPQPLRA